MQWEKFKGAVEADAKNMKKCLNIATIKGIPREFGEHNNYQCPNKFWKFEMKLLNKEF